MKGFVFDHHVFVNNVCCHYNITETVAAVAVKLTERIEGQWLWDLATQLTRWQPLQWGTERGFLCRHYLTLRVIQLTCLSIQLNHHDASPNVK